MCSCQRISTSWHTLTIFVPKRPVPLTSLLGTQSKVPYWESGPSAQPFMLSIFSTSGISWNTGLSCRHCTSRTFRSFGKCQTFSRFLVCKISLCYNETTIYVVCARLGLDNLTRERGLAVDLPLHSTLDGDIDCLALLLCRNCLCWLPEGDEPSYLFDGPALQAMTYAIQYSGSTE